MAEIEEHLGRVAPVAGQIHRHEEDRAIAAILALDDEGVVRWNDGCVGGLPGSGRLAEPREEDDCVFGLFDLDGHDRAALIMRAL